MQIRLLDECADQLRAALQKAGTKEIGGQVFGEQLAPSNFRATEVTIQKRMGSFARFMVDLVQAARDAFKFFERTNHRYMQFNYIGEWHSHPSFDVRPSGTDVDTMRELVADSTFAGNFAVLMIVKLNRGQLLARAWVFDRSGKEEEIVLEYSP